MSAKNLAKFVYRDRNLSPQSLAGGLRAGAGRLVLLLAGLAFCSASQANGREDYKQHGDLKIFYSAFPSTFIPLKLPAPIISPAVWIAALSTWQR